MGDALEKRLLDAQKERAATEARMNKCNREIASLETSKLEDDHHTEQLNKLVDNLESSLESYKSRAEEAELMADHNLNLFRRKQQELEELEEKIKNDEQVLKTKIKK